MYTLRLITGLTIIVLGIALGFYVGIWWAFIGGIVQIIQEVQADVIDALAVACGVAKVLFAGSLGTVVGFVVAAIGYGMLPKD